MKMLINGAWIDRKDKIIVRNPFNNDIVDRVPKATSQDIKNALKAAASYDYHLTSWERYSILKNLCDILEKEADYIIGLISEESGKPISESKIELERSCQTFLISAEEAKRITGEVIPVDAVKGAASENCFVIKEPIGPIVAITPFNYPLNLVAHKVGPALAANNPIILKPSEKTPLTALRLGEYLLQAGLPKEMIHILTGDPVKISDELTNSPIVKLVSFTGSVDIGKEICSKTGLAKVAMELGGNDPLIVLKDADLEEAAKCAAKGAFGNNGQRCTSIKRIIIEQDVADDFISLLLKQTKVLVVGDPFNDTTDIGPLIDEKAAIEVESRINDAISRGAKLIFGGKRTQAIIYPTILDNVKTDFEIVTKETFGPIAPIIRVKNFKEAINVANSTQYGLQSGIFTNDLKKAFNAIKMIEAGAVMVNKGPGFRAEHLPFGGVKESGLGREGIKYAINNMTKTKTVVISP